MRRGRARLPLAQHLGGDICGAIREKALLVVFVNIATSVRSRVFGSIPRSDILGVAAALGLLVPNGANDPRDERQRRACEQ